MADFDKTKTHQPKALIILYQLPNIKIILYNEKNIWTKIT